MPDPAIVERLAIIDAQWNLQQADNKARDRIMAALLLGEMTLFGERIAVCWPDGLPNGITEDNVREYALSLRANAAPELYVPPALPPAKAEPPALSEEQRLTAEQLQARENLLAAMVADFNRGGDA